MDATALAGALKWKWPDSTCDYYFDGSNVLNVYNWQGGTQPTNAEIEQAIVDYKASGTYLLPIFDPVLAIAREAQVFDAAALMRFMACGYLVNTLITYKNFWGGVANGQPYAGLQQIGTGLVAAGVILQADYDALNNILKEQGIDLSVPLVN